ncbi:ribosomal protein S30 [Aminobacter lissarensis]|uniref:Ribosomal protein S30 n=1 Tax=Aminobacter carboxidus TaxID=376165 RepID=A0A8E1WBV8_9HYPH|nr:hypothetical protein [Aminobacter lissarensis]MBB6465408.1 ribosomal protein S30 [Aminobacter lissarensis]
MAIRAIPGKVRSGFPSGIAQKQEDRAIPRFEEKRKCSSEVLIIAAIAAIPARPGWNWCPKAWEKESPKAEHGEKPGRKPIKGSSK